MPDDAHRRRIAMFGLGEAGSLIATDLVTAGAEVRAYDPAAVPTPAGVSRTAVPADAVGDAELVLGLTAAADATEALEQALDAIPVGALYADLSTSAPAQERALAAAAATRGLEFADVALMSTVRGKGLGTPQLASGDGADRYARLMVPLGAPVTVVGSDPGAAATRKLLRSIFMKGMAALAVEALRAGQAADLQDWLWSHLVEELAASDGATLARLVDGTGPHARRRHEEMQAVAELLDDLGVDSAMTRAVIASLADATHGELPDLPGGALSQPGLRRSGGAIAPPGSAGR